MFRSRRVREDDIAAMRAEVESLQGRLSADVTTLDDGGDRLCAQALVDAAERSTACGALLARASTVGELAVARRVAIEGLMATRVVREKQGLPTPDVPPLDAPAVSVPTPVAVDGDEHVAHPDYHPERPHYFGGGQVGGTTAPAGYYRTPFWKKALAIGGAVVGAEMLGDVIGDVIDPDQGFGGGWGDGYGGGYGDGDWGGD